MKFAKLLLFASLAANCRGMNKEELLKSIAEYQQSLNRDVANFGILFASIGIIETLKFVKQCGNQCPIADNLPVASAMMFIVCDLIADSFSN